MPYITGGGSAGGGGSVNSVTAGDSSITVAGTAADPTVKVATAGVTAAKMSSGAAAVGTVATADGAGAVTYAASGGGPPTGAAGGVLDGTYPNPGIAAAVAGAGLAESADVLSVTVDATTIEIAADTLGVKAGGIGTTQLANAGGGAAGPTGSATVTPIVTVDAKGRVTALTSAAPTLNSIATANAASADVALNAKKITGLANGTAATDAAAFGQIPAAAFVQLANGTSPGASIDLTSISGSYNHLELLVQGDFDNAVGFEDMAVRFNNDSGANYASQQMGGQSATAFAGKTSGQTSGKIGTWSGTTKPAGNGSYLKIEIPCYKDTTFNKTYCATTGTYNNSDQDLRTTVGQWANTAAITRITIITLGAGAFATGTHYTLYGKL